MRQQVAHGDVLGQCLGIVERRSTGPQHARRSKGRDPLLDRLVERDAAFVHEHQRHHGGDQLGVRLRPVDMVRPYRLAPFDVGFTDAERVDHSAAPEYQC